MAPAMEALRFFDCNKETFFVLFGFVVFAIYSCFCVCHFLSSFFLPSVHRAQMAPAVEALSFVDCNKAIILFDIFACRCFILFDIYI